MRRLLAATICLAGLLLWNSPPVSATVSRTVQRAGPFAYVTVHGSVRRGVRHLRTSCPANHRVTGAGATIGDRRDRGENHLGTLDIIPDRQAQTDLVYGRPSEKKGSLTAICLRLPDANGLSYPTSGVKTLAPQSTSGIGADCGVAGPAVGGGATLSDSSKTALPVNEPDPNTGFNGWLANASNPDTATHTATVHASCLAQTITLSVVVVQSTTQLALNHGTTLSARCPQDTHVSAGGYDSNVIPIASHPIDGRDRGRAPDDGWSVRAFNNGPFDPITFNVYALCVRL